MLRLIVAAVLSLPLAAPAFAQPGSLPPPIAQAMQGKLQCYEPNRVAKTCQSLAGYREDGKGAFENFATVLIAPKPQITMEVVSLVAIRNGEVCGVISVADLAKAKFNINSVAANASQETAIRQLVGASLTAMADQEICTGYAPDGDGFVATATMNGAPFGKEQKVIWVSPDDGYKVSG